MKKVGDGVLTNRRTATDHVGRQKLHSIDFSKKCVITSTATNLQLQCDLNQECINY